MRLLRILEAHVFDEEFIRSVAKDRGIDLSDQDTAAIKKMHGHILDNAMGDEGQDYYDAAKEYFNN